MERIVNIMEEISNRKIIKKSGKNDTTENDFVIEKSTKANRSETENSS